VVHLYHALAWISEVSSNLIKCPLHVLCVATMPPCHHVVGLLPPLFEKCVVDMFQSAMNDAIAAFQHSLNIYDWHIDGKQLTKLGIPVDAHGPLLEYPPLATLINSFITAFNNLRHCAPLSVKASITAAVERTLMDIAQKLHKLKILSYTNTSALDVGTPLLLSSQSTHIHDIII
jgi:hypothetical protein